METKDIISFIIIIALIGVLGSVTIYISEKVSDKTELDPGTAASGTLTLSGNVSCGELINVTNIVGKKVTFQLNITGIRQGYCVAPLTIPYHIVQIPEYMNTSTTAAINITTAMNANTSISGTMTATNPSVGVVNLAYDTQGTTGNGVLTVETLAAGVWSGGSLSSGAATDTYYNSSENVSDTVSTGWSFTEIVIIAIAAALIITAIFGVIGGFIRL